MEVLPHEYERTAGAARRDEVREGTPHVAAQRLGRELGEALARGVVERQVAESREIGVNVGERFRLAEERFRAQLATRYRAPRVMRRVRRR